MTAIVSGETLEALVDAASGSTPGVPRRRYMERILAVAREARLPPGYLEELAGRTHVSR